MFLFSFFLKKENNECILGTNNCDISANCTNTIGSYTCECKTGYSGNGFTCNSNCLNFFQNSKFCLKHQNDNLNAKSS